MGLVFLSVLAAVVLGGIIYLLLSAKSSHVLKLAALIALIVNCLALGVCAVILVYGPGKGEEAELILPILVESKQPAEVSNLMGLIAFLLALLAFFSFIIFLGIRDKKKRAADKTITRTRGLGPKDM